MKTIMLLALLGYLTGCALVPGQGKVTIVEGRYAPVSSAEPAAVPPWDTLSGIDSVFIDGDNRTVWILFEDTSLLVHAYETTPQHQWMEGCPTNLSTTLMQVGNLGLHELAVGTEVLPEPILVRDCPADPVELVLRDGGNTTNGGNACTGAQVCQVFHWTPGTLTLPTSMKGYELYSWQADKEEIWLFTLVTGTNRTKTWEEISSPDSRITDEAWVKITVRGKSALKSVIDRMPEGEVVIWRGAHTLSGQEHPIGFPDEAFIEEISTYSQQRKIDVHTSD